MTIISRKFRFATLPLCGIALLTAAAPGLAQAGTDEGEFKISVAGRQAGEEQFTIREAGSGSGAETIATGKVRLLLPSGTIELTPRLRASGIGADPVAYEVAVEGTSPRKIVGTIGGGRFSAKIVSPSGEQLREYVASSGALVLDDGVAHHYYFLARRLREGTVPVIIPRENRQVMATVRNAGEEQIRIGGAAVSSYHLVVQPQGGDERHVWVDVLNRVLKVEIPAREYLAVRTALPG